MESKNSIHEQPVAGHFPPTDISVCTPTATGSMLYTHIFSRVSRIHDLKNSTRHVLSSVVKPENMYMTVRPVQYLSNGLSVIKTRVSIEWVECD